MWVKVIVFIFLQLVGQSVSEILQAGYNAKLFLPASCKGTVSSSGLYRAALFSQSTPTYPSMCDAYAHIAVTRDHGINITFTKFQLQKPVQGACGDYVRFFQDTALSSALTGPLCGYDLPPTMLLTSDHVTVQLITDAQEDGQHEGFELWYNRIGEEDLDKLKEQLKTQDKKILYVDKTTGWLNSGSNYKGDAVLISVLMTFGWLMVQ